MINSKDFSSTVSFKDTEFSNLRLINTKVILRMANTMARVNTLGAQEILMKDHTRMVRSMVTEYILILMDQYIRVNGLEENAMVKEFRYHHKEGYKKSFSKWEKRFKPKIDIYSYSFFIKIDIIFLHTLLSF